MPDADWRIDSSTCVARMWWCWACLAAVCRLRSDLNGTWVLVMAEFADRLDAGRRLADRLEHLRGQGVVVLGMPRGGLPVAFEVARALAAPLDALVVRKLGVPSRPELAMGAIGEGGVRVLDVEVLGQAHISEQQLRAVETRERAALE